MTKQKGNKKMVQNKLTITESELMMFESMQMQMAQMKRELAKIEGELENQENSIIQRLQQGAEVLSDKFSATLQTKVGPSRPKWKEEYVAHMEAEHNKNAKEIQAEMQQKYPGNETAKLVIAPKM
ncbi:hypothetical protein EBZ39_09550 [bacterium]|nr:hypothetical protein [bacterium]